MKQELNYNIHDAIKFRITRTKKATFSDLINLKFSFFQVESLENPDIVLNIDKFVPSNDNCYLVDHKWFVKEDYIFCEEAEGSAKWKVEIKGLDNENTEINFDGRVPGFQGLINRDFIAQMLLLRIIEYKLARKGYYLLHGAGVSKNGYGYVFAGRGGTFKSTICMNMVRNAGFEFLGDDHVLIHDDTVLSFPTSLAVLDFMYQNLPDENAWNIWNKLRFARYLWGKRASPNSPATKISATSKLRRFLFIVRTDGKQVVQREIKLSEAVDKFILDNRLEDFIALSRMGVNSAPFLKQDLAYSFVFPSNSIASFPDVMKGKIEALLSNMLPIYEIQIPGHFDDSVFQRVHELLDRV